MSEYDLLLTGDSVKLCSDSDEIHVCEEEMLFEMLNKNNGLSRTEAVNKIENGIPVSSKLVRKCQKSNREAAIFLEGYLDTV